MVFFGEYLVEKKLITKAALLEGLLEQMRRTPPVWEIVIQRNLLSVDDALKVIGFQVERNVEFKAAAQDIGLWTEMVERVVTEAIGVLRIPIGQVLVEQGKVTFEDMTHALDEFLDLREKSQGAATSGATGRASASQECRPAPAEPRIYPIAPAFLKNYQEFFTETRLSGLDALFQALQKEGNTTETVHPLLERISLELHELKEIARFINATVSARLLTDLLCVTDTFLEKSKSLSAGPKSQLVALGLQALRMLRELRLSLVNSGSEASFWEAAKDSFLTLERELVSLRGKK